VTLASTQALASAHSASVIESFRYCNPSSFAGGTWSSSRTCQISSVRWREPYQASTDCPSSTILRGGRKGRTTRRWPTSYRRPQRHPLSGAANNDGSLDHGKTEAALFHKKRTTPAATGAQLDGQQIYRCWPARMPRQFGSFPDNQPRIPLIGIRNLGRTGGDGMTSGFAASRRVGQARELERVALALGFSGRVKTTSYH